MEKKENSSEKKERLKFLIVECPCGRSFVVSDKGLREHPQEVFECPGSFYLIEGKPDCERKYSATELEKNFYKEIYYSEK
jgi:chromosome condensin MukBEF ATPase and DNA-binding subunit MukB